MGQLIDMAGKRFGRLTVIERAGAYISNEGGKVVAVWKCRCDCGNIKNIRGYALRRGAIRSCGCLRNEAVRENLKKRWPKKTTA